MKYDKEHIDIIINQLNEGNGRVAACKAAGISFQTFCRWMEESEFSEHIKKAELNGNLRIKDLAIRAILSKFATQWQSAAWFLERSFPDEFRNRMENEVNIKEHREILKRMFDAETQPES